MTPPADLYSPNKTMCKMEIVDKNEPETGICDILYGEYYENHQTFSRQTSLHWKKYGEFQLVRKSEKGYKLLGAGFGDFVPRNIFRSLINLPARIYLSQLLKGCDPRTVRAIRWVAGRQARNFSYDLARMALTIDLLIKQIPRLDDRTFCIIGDGYGSLGCLIKKIFPDSKIIFVNLGRTLFFDVHYSQACFPELEHALIRSSVDQHSKDFSYIEAEHFECTVCEADVFINIASMQEMNYEMIASYFAAIRGQRSDAWFYCCNRISKALPDGTMINFADYGWVDDDQIMLDELCPWYQRYPKNSPPFFGKFDGPIKHRLIQIDPRSSGEQRSGRSQRLEPARSLAGDTNY